MGTLKNRLIFFVLVTLVLSIEANISEFDEVWQTRATQAKKTAQDSYNPHPETVADNLNKHVHKYYFSHISCFLTFTFSLLFFFKV